MNQATGRFSDDLGTLFRRVLTPDAAALLFALALLLAFFTGFWYRTSPTEALTGWQLIGSGDVPAGISGAMRLLIGIVPLLGLFALALLAASVTIMPALHRRISVYVATVGLISISVHLLYLVELAGLPTLNRVLDLGFWLTLGCSFGLILQAFFNRPGRNLTARTALLLIGISTALNAAVYSVTLITEILRSRADESVAFEITAMIGLALYGAIVGTYLTGNIFRRKGLSAPIGRLIGLPIGAFGHILLLIPFWIYVPPSSTKPSERIKLDEIAWGMALLAPWLVTFILFTIYPMLDSYRVALYNWQGFGEPSQYVGLRHLENVIKDPLFWDSLRNTVVYTLVLVPIQLSLALILALILNRRTMRFAVIYRTLYFLPAVTSVAVVAVVMRLILGNFGTSLSQFLGINPPVNPISDPTLSLYSVILFGIWHSFGVNLVYFLAALQTVPQDLYDAAQVDGAGWFQQLIHVTLPSIQPISVIVLFMAFIGSMYVFEQSFVLTRGGPYFASQVVTGYIYGYAFRQPGTQLAPNFGYASAAALFFALIMLGLTVTNYIVTNRMRKAQ